MRRPTSLPGSAAFLEFFDSLSIGVPVGGGVNDARKSALLQQLHKLDPAQPEFARSVARRDQTIGEERKDGFLSNSRLQLTLIDGAFGGAGPTSLGPGYRGDIWIER